MKERSIHAKRVGVVQVDKRDLVNFDLYNNDMNMMAERLNATAMKYKEVEKQAHRLQRQLEIKKQELQAFRNAFDVEEMTGNMQQQAGPQNFFQHLQSFEDGFKDVRQEINEFIEKWK